MRVTADSRALLCSGIVVECRTALIDIVWLNPACDRDTRMAWWAVELLGRSFGFGYADYLKGQVR